MTFRELPNNGLDPGPGFWKQLVRDEDISGFGIQANGESVRGELEQANWRFVKPGAHHGEALPVITLDANWNPSIHRTQGAYRLAILSTKHADPAVVSVTKDLRTIGGV